MSAGKDRYWVVIANLSFKPANPISEGFILKRPDKNLITCKVERFVFFSWYNWYLPEGDNS